MALKRKIPNKNAIRVEDIKQARKFVNVSHDFALSGRRLIADVYFYMPLNHTIVFFRHKDDELNEIDWKVFHQVQKRNVLILRSDYKAKIDEDAAAIRSDIQKGQLHTNRTKETAEQLLQSTSLHSNDETAPEALEFLESIPQFVHDLISSFEESRSAKSYELAVRKSLSTDDPLEIHQRLASSFSILMMLSFQQGDFEELADLGTAGLVHDVGMLAAPQEIDLYLCSESPQLALEKLINMDHPKFSVEALKKLKIPLSMRAKKIILQHHEHWDGTGEGRVESYSIDPLARILRVADEISRRMQASAWKKSFEESFRDIQEANDTAENKLFDPEVIGRLDQFLTKDRGKQS